MRQRNRAAGGGIAVWDAPTRLFHWALALLVLCSWVSIKNSWMQLHFLSGYSILTLLLFRLVWGFVGSETARFASFLASPWAALRHLAHLPRREPDTQLGHNAAGGWMVLAMLAVLCVQVGTGLFANDDIITEGPLAHYAGKALSDRLSVLHIFNSKLILVLVAAHLVAIVLYAVLKRHDLVRPMLTGRKALPAGARAPRVASLLRAALVFAAAVAVVVLIATAA